MFQCYNIWLKFYDAQPHAVLCTYTDILSHLTLLGCYSDAILHTLEWTFGRIAEIINRGQVTFLLQESTLNRLILFYYFSIIDRAQKSEWL